MRRTVIICSLLVFVANIVFSQKFWSPREIVLDTYEKPIPFQRGGETCIAYELHITNMDSYPISLKRIEILLDRSDVSYKTYSSELLKKSLSRIKVPGGVESDFIINAGQRAILHVILGFASNAKLPKRMVHRVVYSFIKEDKTEVETITGGGAIEIDQNSKALVLGAPLGEGIWVAGNGVSDGYTGHRRGVIRPHDGIPFQKARYAFDFTKFNEEVGFFRGDISVNANRFAYDSPVLAVADARVESVQDNVPDSRPLDPDKLRGLTRKTLAGNYIVLDLGNNLYALYGHLKPGSLLVKKGDVVRKGQVIGLVGNSGNSDAPHLHFQVNSGVPIRGEAVPYVFETYEFVAEAPKGEQYGPIIASRIADPILSIRRHENNGMISPGDSIMNAIEDSIVNDILKGVLGSAFAHSTPGMNQTSETRTCEMPVSGSLIRFTKK